MKCDGVVGEDREAYHSFVSNDFYAVFASGLMRYKAPRATAYKSVFKAEAGTDGIFGLVESAPVAFISAGFEDATEYFLQQVYLMGSQVVEVTSSGNIRVWTRQGKFSRL